MMLAKKLWLTLFMTLLLSIGFAYGLSYTLYEKLYVESIEKELLQTGKSLALDYDGGEITDEFASRIDWYNEKAKFEAFAVRNPRELAACVPFEVDYDTLIGPKEREQLLKNEPVKNVGYVSRFDRNIITVIVPLLEEQRLQGIIYLYIPLENIEELTVGLTKYWAAGAVLFLVILLLVGTKWTKHMTRPLEQMKSAAVKVSEGDFTARVTAETNDEIGQLAKTFNKMAESIYQEDEKKREFLATVSHELRTPLSYIKGYSEAIDQGMAASEDVQKQYIHIITKESKRMERLVNDLLDLIKLEGGNFLIEKYPIPFAETIYQTVQKLEPAAKNKKIGISCDLDHDIIIEGDEGRLEQVVVNILDNAIRYTNEGGKIQVSLFKDNSQAILSIADTGIGIPGEDLKKVTERFYRVNKARTRADGGTGLGLSIVDHIIKFHDGRLEINSEYMKGTEVKVFFPLVTEEEV
ncbi:signal transduction histidine kinase [Bacillus ectoiniformans]|uniref:sensor histidine kinase n=1 Tax=Bacillus ectoiniformans TaxID=1494429 RepID=UPI00195A368E|nr:HAMP domain-containing sensor histidine kinase [Bacillus ectoiniformans]MBM7647596.1 signal transduction histidine kinase [Bacillus ectoiniformans]